MNFEFRALLLTGAVLSSACSNEGQSQQPPSTAKSFAIGTFNAGLAADLQCAEQRQPKVVEALGAEASSLDALCVQEFWTEKQWVALRDGVASDLPSSDRPPPEPAACTPAELDPLRACAEQKCAGMSCGDLGTCAASNCVADMGVSPACLGCIQTQLCSGPIDVIYSQCTSTDNVASYDVGLLGRRQLDAATERPLTSAFILAAIVHARVSTPVGAMHLFCTHLASDEAPEIPKPDCGSWKCLQSQQIDEVLAFIDESASDGLPVVLAGDLNTGPESAELEGVWPDHYQRLLDAGFSCPTPQGEASCTICPDDTFSDPASRGQLIDHACVRGFDGPVRAKRFMTQRTQIDGCGIDGQTSLSDHYGLILSVGGGTQ